MADDDCEILLWDMASTPSKYDLTVMHMQNDIQAMRKATAYSRVRRALIDMVEP